MLTGIPVGKLAAWRLFQLHYYQYHLKLLVDMPMAEWLFEVVLKRIFLHMIMYSKILQAYKGNRNAGRVTPPAKDNSMKNVRSKLSFVRLSLSGALLGVSLVNLVGPTLGMPTHDFIDGVGAVTGFSAVALMKISHLI